jgi:hypothetical protein
MQDRRGVSQRRACKALGVSRSTQRYQAQEDSDEERRLIASMHELVRKYPRYGYRMIGAKLRQEGWRMNIKKIYRLWRREGFKVPRKTRKKRRLGHSGNSCVRRRAEHPDHVWTWDFIHDRTRLKLRQFGARQGRFRAGQDVRILPIERADQGSHGAGMSDRQVVKVRKL